MQEYLYTCSGCEKNFPVTVKLAGAAANCPHCHLSNDLPDLRRLKQLPVRNSQPASEPVKRSEMGSWLFSGGLLVAVLAGLSGLALHFYAASLVSESVTERQIEFLSAQIDAQPVGRLVDVWDGLTGEGLPDWQETTRTRYNKQAGHLGNIANALYAFAAVGVLALVGSFFIGRK